MGLETEFDLENLEAYSPDDLPDYPPEVMRSLLRKQNINTMIDQYLIWWHVQGVSSEAALHRTYEAIRHSFAEAVREYRYKTDPELRNKNAALNLVLTSTYPSEQRATMLKLYDEGRYQEVIDMAADLDMNMRERPNAGKCGPIEPNAIDAEIHMDRDDVIERVEKIQRGEFDPEPTPKPDKGCKGKGFRRITTPPGIPDPA